jgi:hypothetical protein
MGRIVAADITATITGGSHRCQQVHTPEVTALPFLGFPVVPFLGFVHAGHPKSYAEGPLICRLLRTSWGGAIDQKPNFPVSETRES